MSVQRLLMIGRDDILNMPSEKRRIALFRQLAGLTRSGHYLLLTAPQPDQWSSKHGGPDNALLGPDSIAKRLDEAGGVLDGVYYVPRSLLTQRRNREEALRDIMQRYGAAPQDCYLFHSARKFVDVAASLGINACYLDGKRSLREELKSLARDAN